MFQNVYIIYNVYKKKFFFNMSINKLLEKTKRKRSMEKKRKEKHIHFIGIYLLHLKIEITYILMKYYLFNRKSKFFLIKF